MTKKLLKKEIVIVLYVILLCLSVVKIGDVKKITTYNISGINYVTSSHLLTEYKEPEPEPKPQPVEVYKYRLTSYYENDDCNSTPCTGVGLCDKDFQTNEHGWYTYNGKLVLAAATTYLQKQFGVKENKIYFKYGDEVTLTIDGKQYEGIILDTCGACYKSERIDLFVSNKQSVIDRGYQGKGMIDVVITKKK